MKKRVMVSAAAAISIMLAQSAFAAGWQQNATGWWYATNDSGTTWYANCWQWIDGNGDGTAECYYFDANGYMLAATTTPDGYAVNVDGAWTQNGSVQTKTAAKNYVSVGANVGGTGGSASNYTASGASGNNSSSSGSGSSSYYYSTSGSSGSSGSSRTSDTSDDSSSSSAGKTTTRTAGLNYEMAMECLELINEQREAKGLSALEFDDDIYTACEVRAAELPVYFEHERPDGSSCFTALAETGVSYGAAAENIAAGQSNAAAAVTSWMNSSGHRRNILTAKYTKSAIGCIYDPDSKYKYYWVELFTD